MGYRKRKRSSCTRCGARAGLHAVVPRQGAQTHAFFFSFFFKVSSMEALSNLQAVRLTCCRAWLQQHPLLGGDGSLPCSRRVPRCCPCFQGLPCRLFPSSSAKEEEYLHSPSPNFAITGTST